jgi:DNA-binding CsgD family transcriptional regulator
MKENSLNEKVEKLVKIYDGIPKTNLKQDSPIDSELLERYLDIFVQGPSFYVIFNTQKPDIEYKSSGLQDILYIQPDEFTQTFILNNIHPEDLRYYYHCEENAVKFFQNLPQEHLLSYKFGYDVRIKTGRGIYKRIYIQTMPFSYFPDGGAKTFVVMTDISHLKMQGTPQLSFIGRNGAPSYYNVYPQKEEFVPVQSVFSKQEQIVLKHVLQNRTSQQIADMLCLSRHTVSNHRKNILKKSKCASLNELLTTAVREGWV